MQKLSFLYLVQCSLFDTDSRKRINVAFFLALFVPCKITKFPLRYILVSNCQTDMMSILAFSPSIKH